MTRTSPGDLSFGFTTSAAGAGGLAVASFEGAEGLSRPYRFDIDLTVSDPAADLDALVGREAALSVRGAGEEVTIRGVITQVEEGVRALGGLDVHRVTLEPRWSLLGLSRGRRVLARVTVPEAVLAVIAAEAGALRPDDVEMRFVRAHARHERLAQEGESALAFLSRCMERDGIAYFFEHDGPRERLVLTDDASLLPAAPPGRVPFGAPRGPGGASVASLRRTSRVASPGGGAAERPGRRLFRGEGTAAAFRAGHRFSVAGHPRADFDRDLVLLAVLHRGDAERGYENAFEALPTADLLRPEAASRAAETAGHAADTADVRASEVAGHAADTAGSPAAETASQGAAPPVPPVWRVGRATSDNRSPATSDNRSPAPPPGAPRPLEAQRHLTVDDDQNARLDAVEQKNTEQDAKNTEQDGEIAYLEEKDIEHDQKLAAAAADAQNTWLRFNVPYGENLTSYLRLGRAPTEGTDIETPLRDKLTLNTTSLDGHFEYTTGNRTVITGGNKEEIVDGKNRFAVNSGGFGLFDADPIYFLDFSQDVTGAWRKSEFTHVSGTQFAIGDTSSWMMGVTGGYFLGIKVEAFASLSMTIGLGINYEHVKGFSFQEAKAHDLKARDRITLRVKARDPFFTGKNIALAGAGILAGGAAAIALGKTNSDRSNDGRAIAAFGTAPTVGLATAASVAAILDVYKRFKRRTAADRADNDSVLTVTEQHIDLKSGTNNTSMHLNGQNDDILISTNNSASFVYVGGPTGAGQDTVYLFSGGTIRLQAPAIELFGPVDVHGNVHLFNDLQVDGNLNGAPFVVAPPAPPPPPPPVPPAPQPQNIVRRFINYVMGW